MTIQTDQGPEVFAAANVKQLRSTGPQTQPPEAPIRIRLRGGSVVNASELTTKEGAATINLTSGQSVKVATRQIELVVLARPNKQTDQNRDEILARDVAGDLVIIRRKNRNLDYVEGILGDVSNQKVQFKYDGEWIGVSRSRIDSFRYFRRKADALEKPRCQLITRDGNSRGAIHHIFGRIGEKDVQEFCGSHAVKNVNFEGPAPLLANFLRQGFTGGDTQPEIFRASFGGAIRMCKHGGIQRWYRVKDAGLILFQYRKNGVWCRPRGPQYRGRTD